MGKSAQKIRAPCPALPVHRLRRCPAFGHAGCIIRKNSIKAQIYKSMMLKSALTSSGPMSAIMTFMRIDSSQIS